jgi:hypothetical protein
LGIEFQNEILERLIDFKEKQQFLPGKNVKKKWQYFDISDNLYPPVKHSFLQFAYDNSIPFHDYINHVRSSQIFGINLFYPLLIDENNGHKAIINVFSKIADDKFVRIVNFSFEYSPDIDLLGEWPGNNKPSEYLTATDLAITFENINKDKIIFLIEIKLGEYEFSPCRGISSNGCSRDKKNNCLNFKSVIKDYKKCFLHQRNGPRSARKYFEYFNFEDELIMEQEECPFINNNQCMRNHALARALMKENNCKKSFFGLIYHNENKDIVEEWNKYSELLKKNKELFVIEASKIVDEYNEEIYQLYFKKRYNLGKIIIKNQNGT